MRIDTTEMLWKRLQGGATDSDYSDWAMGILENGSESREVLLLATSVRL